MTRTPAVRNPSRRAARDGLLTRAVAGFDIIRDMIAEVQQMRSDAHERYPFIDS
jgi:hypothetical protein